MSERIGIGKLIDIESYNVYICCTVKQESDVIMWAGQTQLNKLTFVFIYMYVFFFVDNKFKKKILPYVHITSNNKSMHNSNINPKLDVK